MKGKHLGEFEEVVLLTIIILREEAYGVGIRNEIEERVDRKVRLGALHATLVRLEEKGFVQSKMGEATKVRGGKRKRFYSVTTAGEQALLKARETRDKLWNALPKTAFNIQWA